ncbi:PfkB family carbohydrate kinase [Halobellus salinus]|nr:fructokinase [Halobellus salinus]
MDDTDGSPDIFVAGECLVDLLPDAPGRLATVEQFHRRAGGAPANVAVRLADLGPAPWFWTRLGDDAFGEFLTETLVSAGLPDRFVRTDPDAKTPVAFVAHDDNADREFSFYRAGTADTRFASGTVPGDALDAVEWVVFGGVCLSTEPARTAMFDLVDRARDRNCTVAFDPNARPELWDGGFPAAFDAACAAADVVKATPADLAAAGIEGPPDALLDAVLDRGPHTAFLTLGDEGAVARATDAAPWGPADASHHGYDIDVVDTTGAGDAFTAGAIRGLADRVELAAALSLGNATAAATTTESGAIDADVDRSVVDRLRGE